LQRTESKTNVKHFKRIVFIPQFDQYDPQPELSQTNMNDHVRLPHTS